MGIFFFERFFSYLTTYTSRRVNYSTQQTSCFWQKIPGSECLLLDLHLGGGVMNVDLILCFPFLIAVAMCKGGEERNIPFGPFASYICTTSMSRPPLVHVLEKHIWYPNKLKAKRSLKWIPPTFPSTDTLYQMQYHKQSMVTWGMSVMVFMHACACERVRW